MRAPTRVTDKLSIETSSIISISQLVLEGAAERGQLNSSLQVKLNLRFNFKNKSLNWRSRQTPCNHYVIVQQLYHGSKLQVQCSGRLRHNKYRLKLKLMNVYWTPTFCDYYKSKIWGPTSKFNVRINQYQFNHCIVKFSETSSSVTACRGFTFIVTSLNFSVPSPTHVGNEDMNC